MPFNIIFSTYVFSKCLSKLIDTKRPLITKNVSTEIGAERMNILSYRFTNCKIENILFKKPCYRKYFVYQYGNIENIGQYL